MNSRQRRKQNRRFSHWVEVNIGQWVGAEMVEQLNDMLDWCDYNYGKGGYLYRWKTSVRFCFPSSERAVEFKLRWVDA